MFGGTSCNRINPFSVEKLYMLCPISNVQTDSPVAVLHYRQNGQKSADQDLHAFNVNIFELSDQDCLKIE